MKPRPASLASLTSLTSLASLASLACLATLVTAVGCAHPQKRTDWRNPAPAAACKSDADCHGGTCAMDLGAAQGTCSAPNDGSSGAPNDGGTPNPGPNPGPNVQPSSSDIQI